MSDQETALTTFTPDIIIKCDDGNLYYIPVHGLLKAGFKVDRKKSKLNLALIDQLLTLGVDVAAIPDQEGPIKAQATCYLLNLDSLKTPGRFVKAYAVAATAAKASKEGS